MKFLCSPCHKVKDEEPVFYKTPLMRVMVCEFCDREADLNRRL